MSDPIKILIYDMTGVFAAEEFTGDPGFYYSFPTEDNDTDDMVVLAGPYETRDEAVAAAKAFIINALSDHTEEET